MDLSSKILAHGGGREGWFVDSCKYIILKDLQALFFGGMISLNTRFFEFFESSITGSSNRQTQLIFMGPEYPSANFFAVIIRKLKLPQQFIAVSSECEREEILGNTAAKAKQKKGFSVLTTTKWMALLAAMVVAGNTPAITLDGQWNDWFSYGGTSSDNWNQSSASGSLLNPNIRYQDDSESDADGGQNYDIEQFFYLYQDLDANAYTGGTLYIGMITGYEPSNTTYRSGDLFIDLGYTGGPTTYDLAIATGTESNSRFGDVWANTGNWSTSGVTIPTHSGSNPYRVRESQPGATNYGNAVVDWDLGVGPGSAHNFLEIALGLDGNLEQMIALGGIGFHWTMACGNDNINVYDVNPLSTVPTPPADPDPVPVPVPAPFMLAGMGMALVAIRKRCSAR